jgi:hypothetical protein
MTYEYILWNITITAVTAVVVAVAVALVVGLIKTAWGD